MKQKEVDAKQSKGGNLSESKKGSNQISFPDEYRSKFQIGTSAYYVYDLQRDRFVYMEEAMREITGISGEEFISKPPAETLGEVTEISHLGAIQEFLTKSLPPRIKKDEENPVSVNLIYSILSRDQIHKRIHMKYIFSNFDGNIPMYTKGVVTDITHIQKDGLPLFYLVQNNKVICREEPDSQKIMSKSSIPLSRAELNVLRHTASGLSPKEIADLMKISVSTLYTHRKNIKVKMGRDVNHTLSKLREKGWIS